MRLEDRIAIITGGGRGIGKAIAMRFAREGAHVVLAGPEQEELDAAAQEIESLGRRTLSVLTDVADESQVIAMSERANAHFGDVDILVNNAGVIGPTAAVQAVSREDWEAVLAVNLTGAFLSSKAIVPGMIERRSGRIINLASIAGKMAYALRSPYAVSKWGLIGLTLTMAQELGPYGIQVNAICPGPVEGPRMNAIFQSRADELDQTVGQVKQTYIDTTLLGRMVKADDVAAMAAFLASDEASNITGQAFDVSAGYGL